MSSLTQLIMQHAATSPEGTPLNARSLLHLGTRAGVYQALARLARQGQLLRISHGIYMRPVATRFGPRPPEIEKAIAELSALWWETITPGGGRSANALGSTTQVPVRPVFLTSGPNRTLQFGNQIVDLRHAPGWQLVAPNRRAGGVIRALAWLGPEEVADNIDSVRHGLSAEDIEELAAARARMPTWLADSMSQLVANA